MDVGLDIFAAMKIRTWGCDTVQWCSLIPEFLRTMLPPYLGTLKIDPPKRWCSTTSLPFVITHKTGTCSDMEINCEYFGLKSWTSDKGWFFWSGTGGEAYNFFFFFLLNPYALFRRRIFFYLWILFRHLVGLFAWGISPAPRPLPTHRTTQHRETQTHIHAPIRIRTCDLNIRATEDSTCLRARGYWDRPHTISCCEKGHHLVRKIKVIMWTN
jgi:hypothetical protein